MERIFDNTGEDNSKQAFINIASGQNNSDIDNYNARVVAMITDARSYNDSELAPIREENSSYYYGARPALESDEDDDEDIGRSTQVSTDVRDMIMAVMPSLIRIFTSAENIVEFAPTSEDTVKVAEDATVFANNTFWEQNDGFLIIHSVLKDSLTFRTGIITWWVDNEPEFSTKSYSNITEQQCLAIMQDTEEKYGMDSYEVVTATESRTKPGIYDKFILRCQKSKPVIKIEAVPPDEFRCSPFAKSAETSPLIGREQVVRASELIKRGIDKNIVMQFVGASPQFAAEREDRNPGEHQYAQDDGVEFGSYYIEIDSDGDGIDELHYIETVGNGHLIVKDELVTHRRYSVFSSDPRPHTLIGDCLADLSKDIQEIKTKLLRGSLDSLSQSIFPRTAINEYITNVDDALNQEMGAVIRTKGDPHTAIANITSEFVGDRAFGMMDRIDMVRQSRTGISEASKGVDPKALQSTNLMGIEAIVSGAQERIELIARILAETGFKPLFKGLLIDFVNNPNMERSIKINNKWTPIDPITFDPSLQVRVNPTLGKGSDNTRLQALLSIKDIQMMIITKYGLKNPVVTPQKFLNTIEDMTRLTNIRNFSRYFEPISDEVQAKMLEAPDEPDPALVLAQAEMEKVKASTAKAIAEKNIKIEKIAVEDDFNRDQLQINSILKAAEIIAKEGAAIRGQPILDNENQQDEITQSIFSRILANG